MNWLISMVLAGVMFSSDGNLPAETVIKSADASVKKVVRFDENERFEQSYALNANGRVSVSNVNGSITVETWNKNEVRLEAVKTAETKERLADVEIKIESRDDFFSAEADYDNARYKNGERRRNNSNVQVEFRLVVPQNAILDGIETVNGTVSIADATNVTKASAVNGDVRATNLRGTTSLSTVNGTIEADFERLDAVNKISLDTVNGRVNLTIPSDANATVRADTLNGSIVNDFNLPVRKGQYVGKDLYGRIGSGAVQIKLNSVNGGLAIKRKADGKKLNQSVDLLSQKSKMDADSDKNLDEDIDADVDADTEEDKKLSAPHAKNKAPVKQKEIKQALKEAQKEIEKLKPELEKINVEALRQAQAAINVEQLQAQIDAAKANIKVIPRMQDGTLFVGMPKIEKKSESFIVKGTPRVSIEAKNCAVSIKGWDKSEVSYALTKISKIPGQKPIELTAEQNGSDVFIKLNDRDGDAVQGMLFNELNNLRLEVFVPRKSNLKVVTGGAIRLEGVSGEIDLQGEDEAVNVRDVDGRLSVGTADGRIRLIGFKGAFDGKTGDGEMNLEGDFQSLNALASDGTIVLTLREDANAVVEANTEIEIENFNLTREKADAKVWRAGKGGARYRFSVDEGKVVVRGENSTNDIW